LLVVLAHSADISARWAYERFRARARQRVEFVLIELLGAATTVWQQEFSADGVSVEIRLADGTRIRSGEVKAVLNRMLQPPLAPAGWAEPSDADYARNELTSFAASWVRALAPVVVNEPTPQGLCGRWRAALHWHLLAREVGLPVAPVFIDSANPPPLASGLNAEPSTLVLSIGGECFSDSMPPAIRGAVRQLAILTQTPILGLRFAGSDPDYVGWRLIDATPYPDLSAAGELAIAALEAVLDA
jgi:hypothetical protein